MVESLEHLTDDLRAEESAQMKVAGLAATKVVKLVVLTVDSLVVLMAV